MWASLTQKVICAESHWPAPQDIEVPFYLIPIAIRWIPTYNYGFRTES